LQYHPEGEGIPAVKVWRATAAGVAVLTISVCALLAKADWEHTIEELQVLNQVNHEEIDMLQSKVKELNAELRIKEKKIIELESQPK
jgi:hypothetical protein